MREFSVVEHQYSSTMNNQPQNGSRGLIAEPVAVAVPAGRLSQLWPSVECYQVSNTCSDIIFNDISMPFKVLFRPMQEITILRYRGYRVWEFERVWRLLWFDNEQEKRQFDCCIKVITSWLDFGAWCSEDIAHLLTVAITISVFMMQLKFLILLFSIYVCSTTNYLVHNFLYIHSSQTGVFCIFQLKLDPLYSSFILCDEFQVEKCLTSSCDWLLFVTFAGIAVVTIRAAKILSEEVRCCYNQSFLIRCRNVRLQLTIKWYIMPIIISQGPR